MSSFGGVVCCPDRLPVGRCRVVGPYEPLEQMTPYGLQPGQLRMLLRQFVEAGERDCVAVDHRLGDDPAMASSPVVVADRADTTTGPVEPTRPTVRESPDRQR